MISAKVIADSKNEFGNRITTMLLTYPRIIHSEMMTHRMFSRNASSSRAVPASKLIEAIEKDPFVPIAFMRSHSGMQGTEYITDPKEIEFEIADWLDDRDYAVMKAKKRLARGVTKQLVNRPLETFQYYTTLVTATEWENFFALRCPSYEIFNKENELVRFRSVKDAKNNCTNPDQDENYWRSVNNGQAEIHMMQLAECMWDAYNESTPRGLTSGQWHIPYEKECEALLPPTIPIREGLTLQEGLDELKIKLSTVMAARTSYTVVGEDQKPLTWQRMVEIHGNMLNANPKHMSPFEHCARAMNNGERESSSFNDDDGRDGSWGWSGNFKGFIQYRKMIANENITK